MNKLLGYGLMAFGILGAVFFLNYKGPAIPLRELWFVLSILLLFAGGYFFAKHNIQQRHDQQSWNHRFADREQLTRTGDRIRVTLDNVEVKSRRYHQEDVNDGLPFRTEMLDALYDANRNYKTFEVQQTYIVFYKQYDGAMYKFVSQATTQSADAVARFIDNQKGVDLYIDPKNPTNYYFDFHVM